MAASATGSQPQQPLSGRLYSHILSNPKGQAFIAVASGALAGSVVWYAARGKALKGAKKQKKSRKPIRKALKLACKGGRSVTIMAVGIPIGVGATIFLSRAVNTRFGALAKHVMKLDWTRTFETLYEIGLLTLPLVATDAAINYLKTCMGGALRANLEAAIRTAYINSPYQVQRDPRVQQALVALGQDTKELGQKLAELYANLINAGSQICARPIFLGMHMGWAEFSVLIFYESIMRGFVLRRFLPSLDLMVEEQAKAESEYTHSIGYISSRADEIAFLGGKGAYEAKVLGEMAHKVEEKESSLAMAKTTPEILKNYLGSKLGQVFAFVYMLPAVYYTQDPSYTRTGQNPIVYLTNAVHDLIDLGKSFGLLFKNLAELDNISGLSNRILTIPDLQIEGGRHSTSNDAAAAAAQEGTVNIRIASEEKWDGGVFIEGLSIAEFSDGKQQNEGEKKDDEGMMLKNLSFNVKKGERLLIRGPNGAGKTTLLRLLTGRCGIKPAKGLVMLPPESQTAFLPSSDYFPPKSTLRTALSYPLPSDTYTTGDILEALRAMGLEARLGAMLKAPESLFDVKSLGLSNGEQRRLSLARVWLRKPQIAFLDEPLFSIRGFAPYTALLRRIPTVVTVSHNREEGFESQHTHVLEILHDGSSALSKISS